MANGRSSNRPAVARFAASLPDTHPTAGVVDEARLSEAARWFVRLSVPAAAILLPAAFFLSVLSPTAQQPNGIIYLAFVGAALLAAGVLTLGVGLIRGETNTNRSELHERHISAIYRKTRRS
jgi:hypothetical protein